MKGKEKLTWMNKLLVDWVTKFDKDNKKEFKEKGVKLIIIECFKTELCSVVNKFLFG